MCLPLWAYLSQKVTPRHLLMPPETCRPLETPEKRQVFTFINCVYEQLQKFGLRLWNFSHGHFVDLSVLGFFVYWCAIEQF